MPRSIEIPIKSFPKGWFVTWSVTSQCGFSGNIQIKSGETLLQKFEKTNRNSNIQFLGQGNATIPSQDMSIVVTVNEGTGPIYERHHPNMVLNNKGDIVGTTITICIEDSDDQDFNDYCISLAGWAKKG